jgi:hypothetical protein
MRTIVSTFVLLGVILCCSTVSNAGQTDIIVETGQAVPDGNGDYSSLFDVILNNSGQLLFRSFLTGTSGGGADDGGLFIGSTDSMVQVVREGQAAPDGNGLIGTNSAYALIDSGQASFWSILTGTAGGGADDVGCFRGSGGAISTVVREGGPAPGGIGTFSGFTTWNTNALGQVGFKSYLNGTSGGSTDNTGVFYGASSGSIIMTAREGQSVPNGDGKFYIFGDGPVLNDSGQTAFMSTLSGTSGGTTDNLGIFRGSGGSITRIVRKGQAGPGGDGTYLLIESEFAMNNSGQVVFESTVTGAIGGAAADRGLFRGSGGTIATIAREGQAAPDGNGIFTDGFMQRGINDAGQVAFTGGLQATSGGSVDNYGLFRGAGGQITQMAREGQDAPDGNGVIAIISAPSLNALGQVAFLAGFNDTSGDASDNYGIIISDGVDLIQVARKGQLLSGKTIYGLDLHYGVEHMNGLNDFGQVGYIASMDDASEIAVVFTPDVHWRVEGGGYWYHNSNWTLGLAPSEMYDVSIDPVGSLNVVGSYNNVTVKSLTVGSTGGGAVVLELDNGGDLSALETVTVTSGGAIEIGAGHVLSSDDVINAGDLRNEGVIDAATLANSGMLTGSGRVQANLSNGVTGEIRVSAGQRTVIDGSAHSNAGQIEVVGGEIEFRGGLTNMDSSGLITARDATLRFSSGLYNDGSLALGFGTSDIHGDIENTKFGYVVVSGASQAAFYDDVINDGVIQVSAGSTAIFFGDFSGDGTTGTGTVFLEGDTRPGFSPGEMSFGGDVSIGAMASVGIELAGLVGGDEYDRLSVAGELAPGGTLQVTLIGGFTPQVGDWFDILDFGSLAGGGFDAVDLPELTGRKAWDESKLYTTGIIEVIGMLHGDTDVDWDVDDDDLELFKTVFGAAGDWRTDFNEDGRVDLIDFALMRENFGVVPGPAPGLATSATPEPFTASMLALGGLAILRRRRSGRSK